MKTLKEKQLWLLWKKQTRNGRVAKVPFSAKGGSSGTNEEYSHTWVTYQEAAQAAKKEQGIGIGFKIPPNVFFLDIDHKDLDDPMVKDILSMFNSYTEFSVSGDGIHVYGYLDLERLPTYIDSKSNRRKLSEDYYTHHPTNGLELYVGELTNRYAAYTGKIIVDAPLQDCTDAIIDVLERYMRKPEATAPKAKKENIKQVEKLNKRADNVIQALRSQKNGEKFSRLFDYGEMENCTDHSKLDIVLCALIALRTKDDKELLDAVFRKSALYREDKWEREDYREETITKAIELRDRGQEKTKKIPPFIKINEDGVARVSAPLLAKYAQENLDYLLVRDNGTQAVMKYVYANGVYTLFDTAMLQGIIKGLIAEYDEELVKMNTIKEVVNLLLSDLEYTSQECLNQDENIINFQNGLLKIGGDQIELIPHTPEVLSTIQIPCCWREETIPTPVFDQYMSTLTNGDKEVEQLLLEYMGACISNVQGWRMKKTLFLVGSGNTGKSQLKSLTERLLGKTNFAGIDLSEIEARFGTSTIYGKRLVGSSDMSFMNIREIKSLKRITGGDSIHAEFKGQPSFAYTFQGLTWFCMNKLPRFSGDTGQWVYDRIMVVECQNVIPPDKQDKQLLDKMYAEREGIVQKAIHAFLRVIANGYRFSEPESVRIARNKYQAENSTVITFFEECMCPWPNGIVDIKGCTTGKIHDAYREWCKRNNNGHAKSGKEFRDELAAYLCTTFADMSTRRNGNTFYRDYALSKEAQEELLS